MQAPLATWLDSLPSPGSAQALWSGHAALHSDLTLELVSAAWQSMWRGSWGWITMTRTAEGSWRLSLPCAIAPMETVTPMLPGQMCGAQLRTS